MRNPFHLLVPLAFACICLPLQCEHAPGFQPGNLWMDNNGVPINAHGGGILLHEGTYYWFGEHKTEGRAGNSAHVGVHVYSSPDLYHWKDEGIALKVSDDSSSEIAEGCIIERPKVIFNPATHKFVMWFHLEMKGLDYKAARAAVAVSDHATGPFTYLRSFRMCPGRWPLDIDEREKAAKKPLVRDFAEGQMSRDMTLFVDTDGKAYQIASSEDNQTLHLCELSPDYTEPTGKWMRLFQGKGNEAPAMFKHDGKYYLITSGCSGWKPNAARSAMASSIWGPWQELGNPCRGTNIENATTFKSQGTYVLPVPGNPDAFIFMADRWRPDNAIDGRYVWLPLLWEGEKPILRWLPTWNLGYFQPARENLFGR